MGRPQMEELTGRLRDFLAPASGWTKLGRSLTVYEPETAAQFQFRYREVQDEDKTDWDAVMATLERGEAGRKRGDAVEIVAEPDGTLGPSEPGVEAYVWFGWSGASDRGNSLVKGLGFALERWVPWTNPETGEPTERPTRVELVLTDPDEAVTIGLRILDEIMEVSEDAWLWITDLSESDEWPDPLPKPAVWPAPAPLKF